MERRVSHDGSDNEPPLEVYDPEGNNGTGRLAPVPPLAKKAGEKARQEEVGSSALGEHHLPGAFLKANFCLVCYNDVMENLETEARNWIISNAESAQTLDSTYYCQTRDVFQARLDAMSRVLGQAYLISAIAGEIGNNSFDHNVGNWPDIPGIFFGYDISSKTRCIVLADRGRGVFATLKEVKPELNNDTEALKTAFTERLSGRMPERRGNGLKFVRETVSSQ